MADIRPADEIDLARFYGVTITSRWIGQAIWRGRLIAGFGGALEQEDGQWLAFLNVPASERRPFLYRRCIQGLEEARKQGCRTVKALCDPSIPRAEAMMVRLGFVQTDELIDGKAVWQCTLQQ